jgi:hypothetical protein
MRCRFAEYQAVGTVVRITLPAVSLEEYAHVLDHAAHPYSCMPEVILEVEHRHTLFGETNASPGLLIFWFIK